MPPHIMMTCISLLADALSAAERDALLAEIITAIEERGSDNLWTKIPKTHLEAFPVLRASLPPAQHLLYLARILPDEPGAGMDSRLWTELRDRVAWCADGWSSLSPVQRKAVRGALRSPIFAHLGEARRLLEPEQHVVVCCELLAHELTEPERTALLEELARTLRGAPGKLWDWVP